MTTTIHECPTSEIIVPAERVRKEFDQKELAKLAESIKTKGLLQPGICVKTPEGLELVAGERRLRACELAQAPYKYTLLEETDKRKLLEIELEENVCRVNLSVQEEAKAIERLHKLLQEQSQEGFAGKQIHGVRETASYLGKSVGTISEDLLIAKFLDVKEVKEAKTKSEAKKVIKKIAEQYQRAKAFKEAARVKEAEELPETASKEEQILYQAKHFQKKILNGEMEEILPTLEMAFNTVIFDPPWGVDLDKVSSSSPSKTNYEDGEEEFLKLKDRLELLYAKMAENSHLYLFFGIRQAREVFDLLELVGFETNRIPIIWYKSGAHRTRNPDKWPGRAYEPIAFARKGNKILVKKGAPDVIISRPMWGKAAGDHRSAKSPELYRELLLRSSLPGELVLDPMCGTGPLGVAAEAMEPTHKLQWLEIEKEETFCHLALQNVLRGYSDIMLERDTQEGEKK